MIDARTKGSLLKNRDQPKPRLGWQGNEKTNSSTEPHNRHNSNTDPRDSLISTLHKAINKSSKRKSGNA